MSYKKDGEIHIEQVDAKGGTREGTVRWVLGISLLAAIVLMSAIWIFGAFSQGDVEEEINMTETRKATTADEAGDIPVAISTDTPEDPDIGTE